MREHRGTNSLFVLKSESESLSSFVALSNAQTHVSNARKQCMTAKPTRPRGQGLQKRTRHSVVANAAKLLIINPRYFTTCTVGCLRICPTAVRFGYITQVFMRDLSTTTSSESYPVSGQSATGTGPTLITSNGRLPIPIGRLTCPAFIALIFLCTHV